MTRPKWTTASKVGLCTFVICFAVALTGTLINFGEHMVQEQAVSAGYAHYDQHDRSFRWGPSVTKGDSHWEIKQTCLVSAPQITHYGDYTITMTVSDCSPVDQP